MHLLKKKQKKKQFEFVKYYYYLKQFMVFNVLKV